VDYEPEKDDWNQPVETVVLLDQEDMGDRQHQAKLHNLERKYPSRPARILLCYHGQTPTLPNFTTAFDIIHIVRVTYPWTWHVDRILHSLCAILDAGCSKAENRRQYASNKKVSGRTFTWESDPGSSGLSSPHTATARGPGMR
jgi:hypothetical protein